MSGCVVLSQRLSEILNLNSKPKLIIIGDIHINNDSTDLLEKIIEKINPTVFLEISKKLDVGRLFSIWTKPETNEYKMRRKVLMNLVFKHSSTFFPDMDYSNKYYMNDDMRENQLTSNIINKVCEINSQINVLLIGYDHIVRLYFKLIDHFDIKILLPSGFDSDFYRATKEVTSYSGGNYFNSENMISIVEELEAFIDQKTILGFKR